MSAHYSLQSFQTIASNISGQCANRYANDTPQVLEIINGEWEFIVSHPKILSVSIQFQENLVV
jgi:hypothetical protein